MRMREREGHAKVYAQFFGRRRRCCVLCAKRVSVLCDEIESSGMERYNVPSQKRLPIYLNIHREAFSKLWIR